MILSLRAVAAAALTSLLAISSAQALTVYSSVDEENAKKLPWTHDEDRVEMIRWFASVGEPAYPTLLELAQDPRRDVAGAALAALGATQDSRLVEHIKKVSMPKDLPIDLKLERSRTLLRLGDWSGVPELIDGLEHQSTWVRALSARTLWEGTHEKFGYDPQGTEENRAAAVARWRQWWQSRQDDVIRK